MAAARVPSTPYLPSHRQACRHARVLGPRWQTAPAVKSLFHVPVTLRKRALRSIFLQSIVSLHYSSSIVLATHKPAVDQDLFSPSSCTGFLLCPELCPAVEVDGWVAGGPTTKAKSARPSIWLVRSGRLGKKIGGRFHDERRACRYLYSGREVNRKNLSSPPTLRHHPFSFTNQHHHHHPIHLPFSFLPFSSSRIFFHFSTSKC